MKIVGKTPYIIVAFSLPMLAHAEEARAYLDPGSVSYVFQMIICGRAVLRLHDKALLEKNKKIHFQTSLKMKNSEEMPSGEKNGSSFRDPSGFVFTRDNTIYRQINKSYKENYDHLIASKLYDALVNSGLLIPHEEVDLSNAVSGDAYKVIRPEPIPFISYPYEWCFSQHRDAALLTIEAQKKSLEHGMSLKDCSAFNVQFKDGKPILIDTLSFEKYQEGKPWVAYRQFCQHFLAPLALMSKKDIRLNQLFRLYIDGPPIDLTSSLLPLPTRFSFSLLLHIHLHAKSQKKYTGKTPKADRKMSRFSFDALVDSLESAVRKLKWQPRGTEWADYYDTFSYSGKSFDHKKKLVSEYLEKIRPETLCDLGANTGAFSRLAAEKGIFTLSFDIDPACVEKNYLECVKKGEKNILPLLLDLTNPSPGIGWENLERMSFMRRGASQAALALALIHHLAIANNLPFSRIAGFFEKICEYLIIEFIPKTDSQVRRMLSTREDIFHDYTQQEFENEFAKRFSILDSSAIVETDRTLYLLCARKNDPA